MHILNNQHEYGNPEETFQLLQPCQKGKPLNCWESLYIQTLQQQHLLMDDDRDSKPLYSLANTSHHNTVPQQLSRHRTRTAITSTW